MVHVKSFVMAVVVMGLAVSAPADLVVTLQQNLGGYTGVGDVSMEGHPNQDMRLIRWANLGDRTQLYMYGDPNPIRSTVLKFGGIESALPGITSSADITSATLSLYAVKGTGNVTLHRILRAWDEGTGGAVGVNPWDYPDWDAPVDGAGWYYPKPPTVPASAGWTDEGAADLGNHVYSMDVTGKTIGHVQFNKSRDADEADNWEHAPVWQARVGEGWIENTVDLADMLSNSRAKEWLVVGNTLYVDHDGATAAVNPTDAADGCSYYEEADTWDGSGCTGDLDVDKGDPLTLAIAAADDWGSADITAWVKAWYDNPGANEGVSLYPPGWTEVVFYSSEHDAAAGGAGGPAGDYTLGPKLVITYVPEPVTMLLLAAGGVGLVLRKRR